ncbi:DMT family transporter [Brevibacillus humidisoli]|uniref:DMT family transporter n=1 Tax=Brevibacillus humidisoli TaxID=2895522 RepID=UPI001E60E44D|nr:DMT family transporter [Brevibacillus humidisoli]UFJ40656.1 DMT family transporter [Brevibacillus humidisoli]
MQQSEKYIYVILTGVITLWGLNVVMVKYLSFFPPVLIAAIRMTIAASVLLPFVLWKVGRTKLQWQDWLLIIGVSASSITLHQIFIAWGVQHTSAGNTSLILGLNPLVTALLAVPFLGEPLTKRKVVGIGIGLIGVLIVVLSQTGEGGVALRGFGDLLIFLSMLMYVIGGLLIRKATARGTHVLVVTAYSHAIASVLLWSTAILVYPAAVFSSIDTEPFTWLVIVVSGALATGLGTLGWNHGIRQLGAGRTSVFLNGMPLTSLLFAALLLGESLGLLHLLALAMIIMGVYLGSYQRSSAPLAVTKLGKQLNG